MFKREAEVCVYVKTLKQVDEESHVKEREVKMTAGRNCVSATLCIG